MHKPTLALWLALFALLGCSEDPKPRTTNPVDTGDDDDDDVVEMDAGKRDAESGGSRDARPGTGGGGRDATSGGGDDDDDDDAPPVTGADKDASGPAAKPDASGGGDVPKPTACDASKAPTLPALALETVVSGLSGLTYAAQAPGSDEWYLLEQAGRVRVAKGGMLLPTPFLDVSGDISLGLPDDERGLLGIAFPPDYASSGKFYVMLTTSGGNRDTVREYKRSAADPMKADPMSAKSMLQLPGSAFNHNGGNVVFGPDGMLYVGTGDGGGACNSDANGDPQDVSNLFGKILRLDPNAAEPYGAAGNPFASGGDARVLHFGLRNPYRFGFDRATGDLYIGDVGQGHWEELSFAAKDAKGLNFGWPVHEGNHATTETCRPRNKTLRSGSTHTPPIFEAPNRALRMTSPFGDWVSVVGGVVYRGNAIPGLTGTYLFGDYTGVRMTALVQCEGKTSPPLAVLKNADVNNPSAAGFTRVGGGAALNKVTAIVEGNDGEIYIAADFNRLVKVVARK
jgi:glucose/arabinose dehydrogenase